MDGESKPKPDTPKAATDAPVPAPVHAENQTVLGDKEKEASQERANTTINLPPNTTRPVEWVQAGINAVLVIIGVFAICIYGGQLKVMQETLGVMKGNEAANCVIRTNGFSSLNFYSFVVENRGKIPAKNVQVSFEISRETLPERQAIGQIQRFEIAEDRINPGPGIDKIVEITGFTQSDSKLMDDGKQGLIAKISIQYDDGFGGIVRHSDCIEELHLHYPNGSSSAGRVECQDVPELLRQTLPLEKRWQPQK
jgi:hypothetical protein